MLKKLSFIVFGLFCVLRLSAQDTQPGDLYEKNNARTRNLAREAKREGDLCVALTYYDQLYQRDSSDMDLVKELAELTMLTHDYARAERLYMKIVKAKPEKNADAWFYLARMQKSNGKYKEAAQSLASFKKYGGKADPVLKKLAKAELDGCALAASLADSVAKTSVIPVSGKVNGRHAEFSPLPLSDNRMIFGSVRTDGEKIYTLAEFDSLAPRRKLYLAEKNGEEWKFLGEFAEEFNDEDFDIANGTLSPDSSRFYFTRCAQNWQYKTVCQIWVAKRKNGVWSKPEALNELVNVPDYTSTHPTIGRESKKNKEVLYFVSDREGTKGGMDIWFAEYDERKKTFKKPRNAGTKINTPGEEMTPYYDMRSKTLYFSSDGRPGIGGLDIFSATGDASTWTDVKNAGLPINSPADDLDFALKPSGKGGFLVSNRKGGNSLYHATCCDDIYEFSFLKFITTNCIVTVTDGETGDCLKSGEQINVYIVDENGDLLADQTVSTDCLNRIALRPGFDYRIEVKKDGYFTETIPVSTKNIASDTDIPARLTMKKKPLAPIVLSDVRFDYNSATLTPASKNVLDTTLLELFRRNPGIVIELSAHTDDKGSDDYNLRLSQKRAESVVDYLVSKGIRKEQLVAKGYGETMPVAPNSNPDGSDNPAGRELNRRTEFRILGEYSGPDDEEDDDTDGETRGRTKNVRF
jgi:OmpA-OmpF porin, OOP family